MLNRDLKIMFSKTNEILMCQCLIVTHITCNKESCYKTSLDFNNYPFS